MNKVFLIGRTTADIELRATTNNINCVVFTLAVNRDYTSENKEKEADFFRCIAWRGLAETLSKHVKKGHRIAIEGRLKNSTQILEDGSKRYYTDVIVNKLEFLENKQKEEFIPEYEGIVEEKDAFESFGDELSEDDLPFL